ncbi:hypothetical protein SPRG_13975 [Saprolegnia parasitica CBS 223.65]|uniref:PH domain-containing protein n=1 Tax=Saprolegnia parasitica (strain CBS 223.65) TaxID=695850 RepID=A0A067BNU7_SAPPC|nr:hypothetical protein SPRG_13975 [Saprolegnia parasitica CBS 223.65]KDO20149.1 hypothetical protein SPRG_13975 [Saprolegnia parasitica CBS 223.65]|eukprot:XP_012209143.1 hypothetical protein SPRG_13975 [Saprolegnia parasitica CBS 223.65]
MPLLRKTSTNPDPNQRIVLSGWMKKQKLHFKTWSRRFFVLTANTRVMSYYDSEDLRQPRGTLEVLSVHPLPGESNGLSLHCASGKEEKLICDTNVAYNAWFAVLTRAVNPDPVSLELTALISPTDSTGELESGELDYEDDITYHPNPIKMGYLHVHYEQSSNQTVDAIPEADTAHPDTWSRYYCKVEQDTLNCYQDETLEQLYVSGMVRNVSLYDGRKYALSVTLNKSRTVYLCCDSMEEKTNWLLTLEGALKTAYKLIEKRRSLYSKSKMTSHIYDLDLPHEDQMHLTDDNADQLPLAYLSLDEDLELKTSPTLASHAEDDETEASGVWI